MKPIKGSLIVKLEDAYLLPVSKPKAFLAFAQELMVAVRLLVKSKSASNRAIIFLSGQIVEILLKAFLLDKGIEVNKLKSPPFRHDLCGLWHEAFQVRPKKETGNPLSWVCQLNELHNYPDRLRYPQGSHGFVHPSIKPMLSQIEKLLKTVDSLLG